MTTKLVVVRPFATHGKGDVITDATQIASILQGEQAACVVRVIVPTPAAAAAPAAAPAKGA